MYKHTWIFIVNVIFIISCSKDEEIINQTPVADFEFYDEIDKFRLSSTATDADEDMLTYLWLTPSSLIALDNFQGSTSYFYLPSISETTEITIQHIVSDEYSSDTVSKSIQLPLLTDVRRWGLGRYLEGEAGSNVGYEWYLDQDNTGTYSGINCGPTTVTMAIKWYNQNFNGTPQDARNTYRASGGWWYTDDIINYLNDYSVPNYIRAIVHTDSLISEIDNGNIIILCLDMFYVTSAENDDWHIHKFYITNAEGWGHFLILKGYKHVDQQVFFEVYDPYSFGEHYTDNSLKGKDRYYLDVDLNTATNLWWDYAIIVSRDKSSCSDGIDAKSIIHAYGI